jgi:glycerol-3-phosphate dehydrogenase subunit B
LVIGAGMSGMAAALFAAERGIDTTQVGIASEIIFSSGLLDLLSVHPIEKGRVWNQPWDAIKMISKDLPNHPYARIKADRIRTAMEVVTAFLETAGLPYRLEKDRNTHVITSLGTLKPTYCVPRTMWNGVRAMKKRTPGLIIDIKGLRGFSARQISETLKPIWPNLRHKRITFPETQKHEEVYTEPLARSLALPETRNALAEVMRPLVKNAKIVGLPAILGMHDSGAVQKDLENRIGVPLFEIPTMPPSIPGLRIKETFEMNLPAKGVRVFYQDRVAHINRIQDRFLVHCGNGNVQKTIQCRGVILATGRFLGKGLFADRKVIRESIFGIPVYQPGARPDWHRFDFLDPRGHLINQAGIEIDNRFRPLDTSGKPVFRNLFAAGSILAHQDWMRQKCGSGLAIASAYAAVNSFQKNVRA